jgi:hypothetical protein
VVDIVGLDVAAPGLLLPASTNFKSNPESGEISCITHAFAVAFASNVTVITVEVCNRPPSCGLVKIAPSTPALAAPGSRKANTLLIHVFPKESVTVNVE